MIINNSYNTSITGTNFGILSTYPETEYLDSYFFTSVTGDTNIPYTNTINGSSFYYYTDSITISSMGNLSLWIDASDPKCVINTVSNSVSVISAFIDKSISKHIFLSAGAPAYLDFWPITGYHYSSNNRCATFLRNSVFLNKTYFFDLSSEYTIFLVWKDRNTSFGNSIPFALYTIVDELSSEFIFKNQYLAEPQGQWGIRQTDYNIKIDDFKNVLSGENILSWEYNNTDLTSITSQKVTINTLNVNITGNYFIDKDAVLSATGIGYYGGVNENDFLLAELLIYKNVLTDIQKTFIYNYLSDKWNLPYYIDNINYSLITSGGPVSNYSYQDFSSLTSIISLPIQNCLTMLTVDLSGIETSKSEIVKIVYSYGNYNKTITSNFINNSAIFVEKNFSVYVIPSNDKMVQTYYLYLSVFRQDSTINKFILSGDIIKCGIRDFYKNTKLIDSQVTDNNKEVLITMEDNEKNITFINKLNVQIPTQSISGGEVLPLINTDFEESTEEIFLLADILAEDRPKESFKKPFFIPVPSSRINPITPE
jgi:hypothetical protein